jgi:acyl-CoA synthetase (AMP-forming)/AMP-acid ligase II
LQALSEARATLTVAPNFAYNLVARKVADADLRGLDFSSLRAAINGAEPVDPATAEAFCARLAPMGMRASSYFPVYGLAESTLSVAFPPLDRGVKIDRVERAALAAGQAVPAASAEGSVAVVSVGRALEEVAIKADGGHDHEHLPERRLGEIIVRGPSVSPWYFEKHQPRRERRTWLRTGDLGYIADGELYVVDRLKDVIIVAGRNYAPTDIERTAERVEGLRTGRSVAFGVPAPEQSTEALVITAEVQPRSRVELARLREAVRAAVTEQIGLTPVDVCLVHPGALARTSSGKLMRREARERYLAGALEGSRALRPILPIRLAQAARAAVFRWLAARRASQL